MPGAPRAGLRPLDLELVAELLERVAVGDVFQALLEVLLADADFEAAFLDGEVGVPVAVVTLHEGSLGLEPPEPHDSDTTSGC